MTTESHDGRPITIAFAGGGTGGHLTPGMAVAERLLELDPAIEIFFMGAGRPVEEHLLGRAHYELISVRTVSMPRSPKQLLRLCIDLPVGLWSVRRLFAARRPDALVALGGYAAVLPALWAARRGDPIVILEQNTIPGRANRLISRWAREVAVQWSVAASRFKHPDRVFELGNPVRREAMAIDRKEACSRFGLSPEKATILVLGGSQGAVAINDFMFAALLRLAGMADRVQILHSVGDTGYDAAESAYADSPVAVSFHRFVDDVGAFYGCADLAVCRSGATTLAELTANGIPSILIPYPHATDDHQYLNATLLSDAGAAVVHRQDELTAESFSSLLVGLIEDDAKRSTMAKAALALGRPDSAGVVAERIMRHALERRCLRGAS